MNWVHAFRWSGDALSRSQRQEVIDAIHHYGNYSVDTDLGFITAIYNDDDDECIWSVDWDVPSVVSNERYIRECMDNASLCDYLDDMFARGVPIKKKSNLFVGDATKLPLPGARPSLK